MLDDNECDDDVPQLSQHALDALKEFYATSNTSTDEISEDWVRINKVEVQK